MAKTNRLTNGIFTELVETEIQENACLAFAEYDGKEEPKLKELTEEYLDKVKSLNVDFNDLAQLETAILQYRAINFSDKDIKLSIVNAYIYARVLFFRLNHGTKDIRVTVGKIAINGKDLIKLKKNKRFMEEASNKLKTAMYDEINKTVSFTKQTVYV